MKEEDDAIFFFVNQLIAWIVQLNEGSASLFSWGLGMDLRFEKCLFGFQTSLQFISEIISGALRR